MRHEPIELGLASTTAGIRSGRSERGAARNARTSMTRAREKCADPPIDVVDEAFAGFMQTQRRPLEEGFIAKLSAQLEALDQQREQLSQLLRTIDADAIAR